MRVIFTQELEQIGDKISEMSRRVATAIRDASSSLLDPNLQLAEQVILGDSEIDQLQLELDDLCIATLARQQPVATDLRTVVSALRISMSVERMGDLARHIAQVTRLRYPQPAIPEGAKKVFSDLSQAAIAAADKIVTLLESRDLQLAGDVEADDDAIDALHLETFRLTLADGWDGNTAQTVDVTLLARYYERFGDHAVSVAKRVSYLVTGDIEAAAGNVD